jgi:HlyD family secretion protein
LEHLLNWLTGLLALALPGFGTAPPPSWDGYVEAEYVYVSAATPGPIAEIAVREGDEVAAGDLLFVQRHRQQQAQVEIAEAHIAAAAADAANLATGSRDVEIEVVRARLERAQSERSLAETSLARTEKLAAGGLAPSARLEKERAALQSATAQVQQLQAELSVAELPARAPLQLQAAANLRAARAEADRARSELADRSVVAPTAGRIERLFFSTGEVATAGVPVVALLAPEALRVKFYVAQADRPSLSLGQTVAVSCDGCREGLTAVLSRFASEPQFTPPVIYSRQERHRLSYLVEAMLAPGSGLMPGQPATVTLTGAP